MTNGSDAEAGTIEVEAGMSMDSGNTAFACAADGDACTVTITVDADDGTVSATSTGGMVMAGNSAAYTVWLTAAAATKLTAIGMEAAQTADPSNTRDAGLGGDDTPALTGERTDGAYVLSIERDSMDTTVTITVQGAAEDADVEFMPTDLGDGLSMHILDDGEGVEEVVMVYTDIDEPEATPFADEYELDANPETEGGMEDYQSVEVDSENLALIMTDGITSAGSGPITVPAAMPDNEDTPDVDETVAAFETAATFDGALGTLTCAATSPCTVTLGTDGEIETFGTWLDLHSRRPCYGRRG